MNIIIKRIVGLVLTPAFAIVLATATIVWIIKNYNKKDLILKILLTPIAILSLVIAGVSFILYKITLNKKYIFLETGLALDRVAGIIWYDHGYHTVSGIIGMRKIGTGINILERIICSWLRLLETKHCISSKGV